MNRFFLSFIAGFLLFSSARQDVLAQDGQDGSVQVEAPIWEHLAELPNSRSGRYDDMDFVSPLIGWVVNTAGEMWHTVDGGNHWTLQTTKAGNAFRSVAFRDEVGPRGLHIGWAGTVFSESRVLWETRDGGDNWVDITHRIGGNIPAGVCGIVSIGNSAWGVGAFHGSPILIRTSDSGVHWIGSDLSAQAGALVDVYFQNEQVGFAVGGSGSNLDGEAVILRTTDGGATWIKVFHSDRETGISGEWAWKISFPTALVGYVSVEYRGNPESNDAKILKTEDGGLTWREIRVQGSRSNLGLQGLGFISADIGWTSGRDVTSLTLDGGQTWNQLPNYDPNTGSGQLDGSMNRFFMVNDTLAYGVGRRVYKLTGYGAVQTALETAEVPSSFDLQPSFPNPFSDSTTLRYALRTPSRVSLRVIDMAGRMHRSFPEYYQENGEYEIVWDGRNDAGQKLPSGSYIFLVDIGSTIEMKQVVLIR